ncbi:MAG TPA: redoxin domain-containing protein, partial [Microlunatus sp.]|nr:redoxin domain-containing protein [Microlunatus sp.]
MTDRLAPGDTAPSFSLSDADGQQISLGDYAGGKVIVYFYPAAMTPGCTTQAVDFTAAAADLDDAGLAVVGISPDSPEKLAQFRESSSVTFPLLA